MVPLPDALIAIDQAFLNPMGTDDALKVSAKGAGTACILICDITRPVPNGLVLPSLVQSLLDAGVLAEKITVLVATGLHRPNLDAELEELVSMGARCAALLEACPRCC